MRDGAEGAAEVGGQHADVGALRALDARSRCAHRRAASARADRSRSRAPRARPRVPAAPACRAARRRVSAPSTSAAPGAAGRRSARPASARRACRDRRHRPPSRASRRCDRGCRSRSPRRIVAGVRLPLEEQVARDLRRLAEAQRQQPAREGIEGPEVSDLRAAEPRSSARGWRPPDDRPSGLSTSRMPVTTAPRRHPRRRRGASRPAAHPRGARCPGWCRTRSAAPA